MKSAYELAMERLNESDPSDGVTLTNEQKQRLEEIETIYKGKMAEREIFLKQKLDAALANQDQTEADMLRTQIASEHIRLEEERDEKKEKVRQEARSK
jgi:hypothetical protein